MQSDRRAEVRLKVDQTTFLQVLNPLSPDRMPVTILNTSESGMCVQTLTFLARGAQVRVFRKQLQVFGAVRYCTPADNGFRVGIQVSSQQGWSGSR
jgi:hypothetical protein